MRGDGAVGLGLHDSPAFAGGRFATLAQLVFDRSVTLVSEELRA
ncbi:hypothetical protein FHR76_003141 [Rhizobium sp. RAS22]|nr:hypothetical protein [Rhizobium sp. RAS22]